MAISPHLRIAGLALAGWAALAWPAAAAVRLWEAPLTIPTYELGPADPNPHFLFGARQNARPVYPYSLLDTLTNRRVDKEYKAVYLENEYLKVTVLPQFGGKLYAIYDKTAQRDVLYTNHVIKYGIVGIRGAWISGGIEWNFPDGHTVTTVSPIDYVTRAEPDGSASVTVGDTERIQRMQWAVTIRLRPGWKTVETEVRLNNRRDVPGRYWFWATAAAHAADDLRFVYPMREAYPHVFWPVFTFPKQNGVDVGTYREVPNALSLFARNSKRDFMGVYYQKADNGVIHVADHHEVPGKKTWTWGTDDAGQIWVEKLTDKDGQYVEFQAGRYETQMEHEFLAPHRVEHFTEYWYPVNGLGGGFDEANRNAALHLERSGGKARVLLNVNSRFDSARMSLDAGGKNLGARTADLDPARPFTAEFPDAPGQVLTFRLVSNSGVELLSYRTDTPIDGNPDYKPATRPIPDAAAPSSAEQAYVAGLAADKKSQELRARAAYEDALKRDPNFAPARIALGLSLYRTGEYDKAAENLELALRRNPDAADAHYYLGLTRRAQGRYAEANDQLWWCVRSGAREEPARSVLGAIALAQGKDDEAAAHLSQAAALDPRDLKARTLLALADRLAGRLDAAQSRIDAVVAEMPIDYLALSERQQVLNARGQDSAAGQARDALWRLLSREPDSALELAFDYAAVGQKKQAAAILEQAAGRMKYAMLDYALGYYADDPRRYAEGAKADPAFVSPHRVEEIAVLQSAVKENPSDGRAWYYLGNALAANVRVPEAIEAWRRAAQLDSGNAITHRNLGLALALAPATRREGIAEYEKAIAAAPDEFHLYLELSRVPGQDAAARIRLLDNAPEAVRTRPPILEARADAYNAAGRYEDAIRLLSSATFTSGEGATSGLAIYRRAHLGLASNYQKAGEHDRAAAEFLKATEYPRNLGVGRSSNATPALEYVSAAKELEAAGKHAEAEAMWKRAADGRIGSLTDPEGGRLTQQHYYKMLALEHVGRNEEARALRERLAARGITGP